MVVTDRSVNEPGGIMPFVETSAGQVCYRERGSGTPVVLLHVVTHDHRNFEPLPGGCCLGWCAGT
jgi:hypothetical protein